MDLCGLNKKTLTVSSSELVITKEKSLLSPYLEKHIPITHIIGVHVHQQGSFSHGFIQIQTVEQKYSDPSVKYKYAKSAPQATSDENAVLINVTDADGYQTALQIKDFVEAELLKNADECAAVQEQIQEQQRVRAIEEQERRRVKAIEEQEQQMVRAAKAQEQKDRRLQEQTLYIQQEQLRLQQEQMNAMARCPRCGSTSLSGNKKGFGIGKAMVGAAAFGGIGLIAGNIGAKKVRVTCLKCGKQFTA